MGKIILDADLQAKLAGLTEPTVLADPTGKTLGHFLPAEQFDHLLYRLAEAQCPYSPEEIQAMRQGTGGKSLADFWKSLGQS